MLTQFPMSSKDLHSLAEIKSPYIHERWRYLARYYAVALPSVLRRHQLRLPAKMPSYQSRYRITAEAKSNWHHLFGCEPQGVNVPFTYMTTAGTLMLMQILADLGINFRNLLHLKSEITLNNPHALNRVRETFRIAVSLQDIEIVREDRVALCVKTQVMDIVGRVLAQYDDTFIILRVHSADIADLKQHPCLSATQHNGQQLTKRPRPDWQQLENGSITDIDLPDKIGLDYGRLSGDLNLVHTTNWAAKLFGYPQAFVQGFFLINQVLATFATANNRPPRRLSIHFARPAYTGQKIQLVCHKNRFGYRDSRGKLIAAGTCQYETNL